MADEELGYSVEDLSADETDPIERIILRSMHEGVITVECNGDIHTANRSARRILGFEEGELEGKPFDEVFSQDPRNEEFSDVFARVIHLGKPTIRTEVRFKRKDGQTVDLSMATSFLEVDVCRPAVESIVAVFRDITAFKAMERVRRRAVDHLSHELKTPLAIIRASVNNLLKKDSLVTTAGKSLDRINRNLDRLTRIQEIVEEVLNPRPFRPRPFDAVPFINGILEELRSESSHRSVELALQPGISHEGDLHGNLIDPDVLAVALRTLVKNSIESTPDEGEVTVSLERTLGGDLLKVIDSGVGIRVADQEFIFDGFHHTQSTDEYSSKRPYDFNAGGKGLELLRLKMLAEVGYFDLSFESERCRYIPTAFDHCPGRVSECPHIDGKQGCRESGGTTFLVMFHGKNR